MCFKNGEYRFQKRLLWQDKIQLMEWRFRFSNKLWFTLPCSTLPCLLTSFKQPLISLHFGVLDRLVIALLRTCIARVCHGSTLMAAAVFSDFNGILWLWSEGEKTLVASSDFSLYSPQSLFQIKSKPCVPHRSVMKWSTTSQHVSAGFDQTAEGQGGWNIHGCVVKQEPTLRADASNVYLRPKI